MPMGLPSMTPIVHLLVLMLRLGWEESTFLDYPRYRRWISEPRESTPIRRSVEMSGHGFFYYNQTWISGFTNSRNLMGNWVGREGQGVQAWTSYWLTPRNKLQFEFRHLKISREFISPRAAHSPTQVSARISGCGRTSACRLWFSMRPGLSR